MNFAENIKTLCKQEGISLTEFSALTGIAYSTMRRYAKGPKTPTLEDIEEKILSVERFKKYRSLLFGIKEPMDSRLDPENPHHVRFHELLIQVREKGLEAEALAILEALSSAQKKDSLGSDSQ